MSRSKACDSFSVAAALKLAPSFIEKLLRLQGTGDRAQYASAAQMERSIERSSPVARNCACSASSGAPKRSIRRMIRVQAPYDKRGY
jgi:hypothetical protein